MEVSRLDAGCLGCGSPIKTVTKTGTFPDYPCGSETRQWEEFDLTKHAYAIGLNIGVSGLTPKAFWGMEFPSSLRNGRYDLVDSFRSIDARCAAKLMEPSTYVGVYDETTIAGEKVVLRAMCNVPPEVFPSVLGHLAKKLPQHTISEQMPVELVHFSVYYNERLANNVAREAMFSRRPDTRLASP